MWIYFRHLCRTQYAGSLNKTLTLEQIIYIERTLFDWMTKLKGSIKINRNIFNELVNVWVERRGGFCLSKEVVKFSLLDVFLGLGLSLVRPKIDLNEVGVDSECRKHFNDEIVDVTMVYEFLLEHHEELIVDYFGRLYI